MKINYYKDTDTLYIDLSDSPGEDTIECAPDVVIDLGVDGKPVGIEIEHASEKTDVSALDIHPTRSQGFATLVWRPSKSARYMAEGRMPAGLSIQAPDLTTFAIAGVAAPSEFIEQIKREMDDALRS